MKNIKTLLALVMVIAGLATSCTKQELDEENQEQLDKRRIQNPRDKR
jgi:hypothetical protein